MHREARVFVRGAIYRIIPRPRSVLEVGSRNVNGGVREMFGKVDTYVGIDPVPGKGVDIVTKEQDWRLVISEFECVVCTEALEHDQDWQNLLIRMLCRIKAHGHLILTCATEPRKPHGIDGGEVGIEERYNNVDPNRLVQIICGSNPQRIELTVDKDRGDLYALVQVR